jgi:dipeptidase
MGSLIEKYGYYGTGETLAVAGPEEAWVMEMCCYDMNGTDGVWVAQRVSDSGFFVAANQFRIPEVHKEAEDMMYSSNIFDVAKRKGWWKPDDGPPRLDRCLRQRFEGVASSVHPNVPRPGTIPLEIKFDRSGNHHA